MTRSCQYPALLTAIGLVLSACEEPDVSADQMPDEQRPASDAPLLPGLGDDYATVVTCIAAGKLRTDLSGVIRTGVDWTAGDGELSCEGMRRPGSAGARLRFSGSIAKPEDTDGDDRQALTFILGLSDFDINQTGTEIPTNVTLVEEGNGRFYATPDSSGCWTDIVHQERIGNAADYRIEGTVYCLSPLAELNGNAGVTFTELEFVGQVNWAVAE